MANQESSFQKVEIAGGLTARNRQQNALMVAVVVVVAVAIIAFMLVLADSQAPVFEQQPVAPVVGPALMDRHQAPREAQDAIEFQSITPPGLDVDTGQYLTEQGWLQAHNYEREKARKAASEAARARWEMNHGQ